MYSVPLLKNPRPEARTGTIIHRFEKKKKKQYYFLLGSTLGSYPGVSQPNQKLFETELRQHIGTAWKMSFFRLLNS